MSTIQKSFGVVVLLTGMAGCTLPPEQAVEPPMEEVAQPVTEDTQRPKTRPDTAVAPPVSARTVEEFDTTSKEERVAATQAAEEEAPERLLGRTIASLGSPTDPGFWAKTPLVKTVQQGRLVYPATGSSVVVELRPLDAEPGAGSQVSLPALRVLGAPLTALPELEVYAR
ncbi:hypothetical protein [Actibacterium lipolyticum]|uniref:D-galactarate dehydratase n=1 Tax=Actibacterium lipolyticum TaxID=1524263 RepID=A0A238JTQ1_9RHOB|nr:hypothetical protein [Actibacterium lipolyticum]SMX34031.1 hypothetical protein COL8621_01155 [Actibacterium lipolyticum]